MSLKNLKIIFIFWVLAASTQVWAHCPYPFIYESENYCLDISWQIGEMRQQGVFQNAVQSPVLNQRSTPSNQWIFSKAHISVWLADDIDHTPVFLENIKVFPYMLMTGGHSHGARSEWIYDTDLGVYVLSKMSFQEMGEGCWQLRMTLNGQEEQVLLNIESYRNLNDMDNYMQALYCSICSSQPATQPNHSHIHHHNH